MTQGILDVSLHSTTGNTHADVRLVTGAAASDRRMPLFVAREDLFYYTREWQDGERESADARARGELHVFDSGAELLEWLDADED